MAFRPRRPSGLIDMVAVFRQRNYRLFWTGTLVSNSGDWMDQVALNWLVLETTGSALYLGLVNLCRALPILALTLMGGVAADRMERRRLMMASQTAGMLLAVLLAVLVATGTAQIGLILLIAVGRGAMVAFNQPARQTLVSELVPRAILPTAIALNALTFNLTKVIGPLLAGVIIATAGTAACFAVNAASFLVVLWTLAAMQFPARVPRPAPGSVLSDLVAGFTYIRANRTVMVLVLVAFIPPIFGQPFIYMLALYTVEVLRAGPEVVGTLTATAALGGMVGAAGLALFPAVGRRGASMLAAMLCYGLLIASFSVVGNLWLVGLMLVCIGACQIMCNATNNILLQTIVPDAMRGRVMSMLFLNKGMVQLGTFLVATMAAFTGVQWALIASGGVVALSAVAVSVAAPTIRNLRT